MVVFSNPLKRFGRYVQISRILLKYGFGEYVRTFHPAFLLARLGLGRRRFTFRPLSQRLRLAIEELGSTFIKIGQVASARGDILPEEFTSELALLQDKITPQPFAPFRNIIESEIGPIEQVFEHFEEEPIGSASIAQVYRARYQGVPVIVKVRRPNIEKIIDIDIDILRRIAHIAEQNLQIAKQRRISHLIDSFERTIRRELDFLSEASNAQRFQEAFQGDPRIYIPKVYREISTARVLVQEWVEGVKIDDIDAMKKDGIDPGIVARNGADIFLKQILINGFFHADPHPGNLFVKEGNVIVPIDFGMVGRIDHRLREKIVDFIIGVVNRNADQMVRALLKVGIVENGVEQESLKEDILYILDKFEGRTIQQLSVADFVQDINRVIRKYQIMIPQDLVYLGKALSQLEALGRDLDPDFNVVKFLKEFTFNHRLGILSVRELITKGRWWLQDMFTALRDLPENLNKFFEVNLRSNHTVREEKKEHNIYYFLSGLGISVISMFLFLVSNSLILKIISGIGLGIAFGLFILQILLFLVR